MIKAIKRGLLVFLFVAVSSSEATVPVVTNVVAVQRGTNKLVDIHFDVHDAEGDLLKINVEVSNNAGQTYSIPASSFTGDYGDNITTGAFKHIVWDAGSDWDGEYSDQMRVKVVADDGTGFPGLEWGYEVAAGGFLMGQDGGAEGNGPSRHVNIPWSFWLSKYEITASQYAEFLNIALAAGQINRIGTTSVTAKSGAFSDVPAGKELIKLDEDRDVVWNVNDFEAAAGRSEFPVRVNWYGALAFAVHFGYDLPTDAEWEKAARGPEHEDGETHWVYPWGDSLASSRANYFRSNDNRDTVHMLGYSLGSSDYAQSAYPSGDLTPVGYFDGNQTPIGIDMANAYGLYDMSGNAHEWCRSRWTTTVETYPQLESLSETVNNRSGTSTRIIRGGGCFSGVNDAFTYDDNYSGWEHLKCYFRDSRPPSLDSTATYNGSTSHSSALPYQENRPDIGFRVVRRAP